MSQDFFDPEIFADFVVEAREHLETIEPKLLELEKDPENLSLIDEIFRPMHSLKGASGFLGLKEINALAHKGENILDELRKGKMKLTPTVMDVILEATDALREMIDNLEAYGNEGDVDTAPIIEHIEHLLEGREINSGNDVKSKNDADEGNDVESNSDEETKDFYALTLASEEHLVDFLDEAKELIENINSSLLELEKRPDEKELLDDIFRYFHNIKGNSGIIGYRELNALTHAAETLLNKARNNEIEISRELVDLLLSTVDMMEELVGNIDKEKGLVKPQDISHLLSKLEGIINDQDTVAKENESEDSADLKEELQNEENDEDEYELNEIDPEDVLIFEHTVKQQFENIDLALNKLTQDPTQKDFIDALYRSFVTIQNSTGYMGLEEIKKYAQRTADLVDQGRNSDMDFSLMLDLLRQEIDILKDMLQKELDKLKAGLNKKEKKGKVEAEDYRADEKKEEKIAAEPGERVQEKTELKKSKVKTQVSGKASPTSKPKTSPAISSTIRVDHSKLDHLMNLIGELIINRNRFTMLAKELEEGKDPAEVAQKLTETTYSMARISDDLQVTIMNVRMVPVKSVFAKFPRLVRDLSRKSGKKIELITEGEETELDKSVIELIGDPLVHLIRNAIDHGLEPEEERRRLGKPPTGKVWLRAAHKGNSVVIEVEDDGRGIDPEKMRENGVKKGIISEEEAQNMDDHQAIDLIFAPGFSTAEKVTDISGRGVGMDVVRNNIKSLKGSIIVQSEVGKGTRFTITLPLTLAIIDALMVKVAGDNYAIPLDAVSETTKIEAAKLSEVNKRKAITLRGEVLGIVELAKLLELPVEKDERQILPIVIISVNERRLGLVVDALLERQEIVIKSLGHYLGELPGISGATIMGDGNVVLILDPHEIYRLATTQATLVN
ncbi:chemotaxis protein CheA [Desulfohalobiaceae bacterium Ax17]|uniref:chemotaxis protein CheA n=1 Tax=Desulfovulcanus ferrireducens TaxID=2831190 RepID=UPI00207B9DCF|nr:chemotaxis protein CheA [Desulfovulcanus ferrireducens]MBT8762661.1 chemotaxis protein CheA [Desulfovulcanus ferrireducens]